MKPLDRSLAASIFSLNKGGDSNPQCLLPSDALVIVIQERPETIAAPPLIRWHNYDRSGCEAPLVVRRKAGKAYSEHLRFWRSMINIAG